MSRVLVLVEGQTEETFVRNVLGRYLESRGIYLIPTLATTKRVKQGASFKGGVSSYGKIKNDLGRLLKDTNAALVTTMLDFYNLPPNFPGYAAQTGNCHQRIAHLEAAFQADIDHRRFVPYLSLHEFEALMFASPETIAETFVNSNVLDDLRQIGAAYPTPEEIDDNDPPSKRLLALYPGYQKPLYGPWVTDAIGIPRIRAACPHFNDWLKIIEQRGGSSV